MSVSKDQLFSKRPDNENNMGGIIGMTLQETRSDGSGELSWTRIQPAFTRCAMIFNRLLYDINKGSVFKKRKKLELMAVKDCLGPGYNLRLQDVP